MRYIKRKSRAKRYAKRKYREKASSEEFLTVEKVNDSLIDNLVSRIRGNVATLNRLIAESGYQYYSTHALMKVITKLKERGYKVIRFSNKRYIVIKDENLLSE